MNTFCCITYGESGVGKTPFAGTLQLYEKTSPCLFLDVDKGAMSLDGMSNMPTVVPIEEWSDVSAIYPLLSRKNWDGLAELLSKKAGRTIPPLQYKSVVIDSGTELEYRLRASIVAADDRQEGIPDQPHYLKTQERYRRLYRAFRDLEGISLVMTAGIRELKDDVAGIIKHFPDFQPSLVHDLVRMTDFVFFMNVTLEAKEGSSERQWVKSIQCSLTQRAVARSRNPKISGRMTGEKFSWKDILERSKLLD